MATIRHMFRWKPPCHLPRPWNDQLSATCERKYQDVRRTRLVVRPIRIYRRITGCSEDDVARPLVLEAQDLVHGAWAICLFSAPTGRHRLIAHRLALPNTTRRALGRGKCVGIGGALVRLWHGRARAAISFLAPDSRYGWDRLATRADCFEEQALAFARSLRSDPPLPWRASNAGRRPHAFRMALFRCAFERRGRSRRKA